MKRVILLILALVLTLSLMACRSKEPEDAADAADNNTLSNSAPLTFAEASALEYDNGQVTCRFRRDEDGWKWVDDEEFPLDASYVEEILTALDAMSVSLAPVTPAVDPADSGLDEPDRYTTVTVGEDITTLRFGDQQDDGQWYMAIDGQEDTYLVADEFVKLMDRSIYDMAVLPTLPFAIWETFYMTVLSTALALVIGLPLGVLLVVGEKGGVLPLPMIRNKKTLNPRDQESAPVYQLETAMGAGIECFPGARAVNVPRSRFFPVKTTSDLFLLRSDAISVDEHGNVALAPERQGNTPVVDLDSKLYKLVDSLDGLGLPSLTGMDKLTLRGRFHFQDGAVLRGTLLMENDSDETKEILPGVYAGA